LRTQDSDATLVATDGNGASDGVKRYFEKLRALVAEDGLISLDGSDAEEDRLDDDRPSQSAAPEDSDMRFENSTLTNCLLVKNLNLRRTPRRSSAARYAPYTTPKGRATVTTLDEICDKFDGMTDEINSLKRKVQDLEDNNKALRERQAAQAAPFDVSCIVSGSIPRGGQRSRERALQAEVTRAVRRVFFEATTMVRGSSDTAIKIRVSQTLLPASTSLMVC
jgi:hypothetical protein